MRIINANDGDLMIGPKEDDPFHLIPQLSPIFVVEINRINVLIFFWRILGIFDRAVRTMEKPFGVVANVRVIGRTIDGKVERHLHPSASYLAYEPIEILQGPELRFYCNMPAALSANL